MSGNRIDVPEKRTEAMHLCSNSSIASNALQIKVAGHLSHQVIEFYLGSVSESADVDHEITRCIGAVWSSVRKIYFPIERCAARPGIAQDTIHSVGGGSYILRMCHVDYANSGR